MHATDLPTAQSESRTVAGESTIPLTSVIFGYGPMLPLVAAAVAVWLGTGVWPGLAEWLAILWGALILSFVAGVRRGFGFGAPGASTGVEIMTMMVYFVPAGLALILAGVQRVPEALELLCLGYALVLVLDSRAARRGDAPAHFARLRPSQMAIAVVALGAILVRHIV